MKPGELTEHLLSQDQQI